MTAGRWGSPGQRGAQGCVECCCSDVPDAVGGALVGSCGCRVCRYGGCAATGWQEALPKTVSIRVGGWRGMRSPMVMAGSFRTPRFSVPVDGLAKALRRARLVPAAGRVVHPTG